MLYRVIIDCLNKIQTVIINVILLTLFLPSKHSIHTVIYSSSFFRINNNLLLQAKNEEIKRRNMLENKMTEILENLKTRLLIE